MKTTLRYLLSLIAVVSVLSLSAQTLAQQPETQMHSTSIMAGSGSSLPFAAVDGVTTTYSPAQTPSNVRKGWGSGSGEPGDRPEPYADPLGDVMWPMALCALAYVLYRYVRTRKREKGLIFDLNYNRISGKTFKPNREKFIGNAIFFFLHSNPIVFQ